MLKTQSDARPQKEQAAQTTRLKSVYSKAENRANNEQTAHIIGQKTSKKQKKVGFTTKYIACLGIFVALSAVANIFSIPILDNSIMISLAYIPTVLAGAFLGPVAGLLTGALGDVLGMIIHPMGAWIPLITVSSAVMGLISGLVFRFIKINPYAKLAIAMVGVLLICTCGLSTLGLFLTYAKGKKTFLVYLFGRLPLQLASFAVNTVLLYAIYPVLQKTVFKKALYIELKKKAKV